jgi:DNA-directed RNA polymerase subunit E'/Rpb7
MADPLFERRSLTRSVHITAPHIQRNILASLSAQLNTKYAGTCIPEGYVRKGSIAIEEYSLGRVNLVKGGLDFTAVKFQADICMPHPGQVFRAKVVLKSKIGLHAEVSPISVLLPRDLHIGNEAFDAVVEDQEIEFKVVGSRFQQNNDTIDVLGTLLTAIDETQPDAPPNFVPEASLGASNAAAAPISSSERRVSVPVEQTRSSKKKGGSIIPFAAVT